MQENWLLNEMFSVTFFQLIYSNIAHIYFYISLFIPQLPFFNLLFLTQNHIADVSPLSHLDLYHIVCYSIVCIYHNLPKIFRFLKNIMGWQSIAINHFKLKVYNFDVWGFIIIIAVDFLWFREMFFYCFFGKWSLPFDIY